MQGAALPGHACVGVGEYIPNKNFKVDHAKPPLDDGQIGEKIRIYGISQKVVDNFINKKREKGWAIIAINKIPFSHSYLFAYDAKPQEAKERTTVIHNGETFYLDAGSYGEMWTLIGSDCDGGPVCGWAKIKPPIECFDTEWGCSTCRCFYDDCVFVESAIDRNGHPCMFDLKKDLGPRKWSIDDEEHIRRSLYV